MSSDSDESAPDNTVTRTPLVSSNEDGTQDLNFPYFEYEPLHSEEDEIRLILLYPALGDDVNDANDHVRCDMETTPLSAAPHFTAVKNARGYRLFESAIEVNEHGLIISTALERFLRNFRSGIIKPTLMWIRHICVIQWDEQEKKRYWTREWSNRMYDLATETIDMNSFNSKLIEDGTITRVIDGRYRNWTKEWHGVPEQIVLPKVFPIWLGTKLDENAVSDSYKYVPLDPVADEIRVMILMPSEDHPKNPVILHAAHCPIKCDVTYSALSYQWGTDAAESEIEMNGQKKGIRASLEKTLRAIRLPDKMMPIWIDAVSINQADVKERSRQIPRMGTIYDNASSVIAYVGAQSEDSDQAIELIKALQEPMMRINDKREWHFGPWSFENGSAQYGENRIPPERLAVMAAALYKFLIRPYFRRAWVLQELAWAANPVIVVGSNWDTGFRRLDMAAYNFLSMLHHDPSLKSQIESADSSLGDLNIDQLAFPRKLFYFRHLISNAQSHDGMGLQFVQIPRTSPGFLETLILARDFESTDPRDKIYALWNLARGKDGLDFRVDYSKPFEKVFESFAYAWINQQQSLDIFGAVEATPESADFYSDTPSWSPNWNAKAQASCLVRKEVIPTVMMLAIQSMDGTLYSADGGIERDAFDTPLFHFEGPTLHATALILDQIHFVLPDPPEIPEDMLFPPCDPLSYHKFQHWTKETESHFQKNSLETYPDPLQAAVAMFHGDVPSTWPPRDENPENCDDSLPWERYVALPDTARHFRPYADSYDRTTAWNVVKTVLRGRRPFVSENGYMGLMPEYLRNEVKAEGKWSLHLAIVATCSVPVILRERGDGSYQLLGTAFMQGWMEGEVFETMLGVREPRDLWETLVEEGMVRIT